MKTREEACNFGLSFPESYAENPFPKADWTLIRFRENQKAFLFIYEKDGFVRLNLKLTPSSREYYRTVYASVQAAYHQNKEHWISIILDGTVPGEDIRKMIEESYRLVSDTATKRIYEAVKRIPKGCVASYKEVAEMAGNAKMSRAVGNALHKNPDPKHIPCHRVVNSKGELAPGFAFGGEDEQRKRLEKEGVEVKDGKVDLRKYGMEEERTALWKKNSEKCVDLSRKSQRRNV